MLEITSEVDLKAFSLVKTISHLRHLELLSGRGFAFEIRVNRRSLIA